MATQLEIVKGKLNDKFHDVVEHWGTEALGLEWRGGHMGSKWLYDVSVLSAKNQSDGSTLVTGQFQVRTTDGQKRTRNFDATVSKIFDDFEVVKIRQQKDDNLWYKLFPFNV